MAITEIIHYDPNVVLVTVTGGVKGMQWRVHEDCTVAGGVYHGGLFESDGPWTFPLSKTAGIGIIPYIDKKTKRRYEGVRLRCPEILYNGHPTKVTLVINHEDEYL